METLTPNGRSRHTLWYHSHWNMWDSTRAEIYELRNFDMFCVLSSRNAERKCGLPQHSGRHSIPFNANMDLCVRPFKKISAFIWHANEDYDHKRKLLTIHAYLLYLLLFIHHKNYESSVKHTSVSVHGKKHILGTETMAITLTYIMATSFISQQKQFLSIVYALCRRRDFLIASCHNAHSKVHLWCHWWLIAINIFFGSSHLHAIPANLFTLIELFWEAVNGSFCWFWFHFCKLQY